MKLVKTTPYKEVNIIGENYFFRKKVDVNGDSENY